MCTTTEDHVTLPEGDGPGETEDLETRQRLKAALHYTVGTVCNQAGEEGLTFSREVVAIITETTFRQAELLATDLELFAKHAKRTTVSVEDVRLCSRRNPSLSEFIKRQGERLRAEKEAGAGGVAAVVEGQGAAKPTKRKGKGKKNS